MLKSASKLGLFLAAIFLIAGGAFIANPQEMTVPVFVNIVVGFFMRQLRRFLVVPPWMYWG